MGGGAGGRAGLGRAGGRGGSAEPKTRTPHKDVGKKIEKHLGYFNTYDVQNL